MGAFSFIVSSIYRVGKVTVLGVMVQTEWRKIAEDSRLLTSSLGLSIHVCINVHVYMWADMHTFEHTHVRKNKIRN